MSDLQQVIQVLASSRKRKQDEEQFSTYEALRTKRDAVHAQVQAINREWKLRLGDVAKVAAPAALTPEEDLDLESKKQDFIDSINVALSMLKAKDEVWFAEVADDKDEETFERRKLGELIRVENRLVTSLDGKNKTFSFYKHNLSGASMLPIVVGDLSSESTLQAYRDFFRTEGIKHLFADT